MNKVRSLLLLLLSSFLVVNLMAKGRDMEPEEQLEKPEVMVHLPGIRLYNDSAFYVNLEVQTSDNRDYKPFGDTWINPDKMSGNETSIEPVSGKLYYAFGEIPKDLTQAHFIPIKFDGRDHHYSKHIKKAGPYGGVDLSVDVKRVRQGEHNYQITVTSSKHMLHKEAFEEEDI